MPSSNAARTHSTASCSSTWSPWVIQFPYAISLITRPLWPRCRYSIIPNSRRWSEEWSERWSELVARPDSRGRHPEPAYLQRPHHRVHGQPPGGLAGQPFGDQLAQAAPDQQGVEDDDHDQHQDQRRDDLLRPLAPQEHGGEQDHQHVHVVLADPALGIHEVTGQGARRTAVARVERPRLAPFHRLVPGAPAGAGLGLLLLGAGHGRSPRPGDRLASLGLGLAALGGGPSLGRLGGGTGLTVGRAVRALRARGILGRAVRRPGATASEHALSLAPRGVRGVAPPGPHRLAPRGPAPPPRGAGLGSWQCW